MLCQKMENGTIKFEFYLKNRGITLIALVITIALNCYRGGSKEECAT